MERVLVGVDGSEGSVRALVWAMRMAASRDAEVVALFVTEDLSAAAEKGYVPRSVAAEWTDQDRAKGLDVLRDVLEAAGGAPDGVTVDLQVQAGYPPQVLIERSADADLLVVGARGLGPLRSILGSVSRRCVEQANCPVTVVR